MLRLHKLSTAQRHHPPRIGDPPRACVAELSLFNAITEIRGMGLVIGRDLADDGGKAAERVARRALGKGLVLRADPDWIAMAPPPRSTQAEADIMFDIFAKRVREEVTGNCA